MTIYMTTHTNLKLCQGCFGAQEWATTPTSAGPVAPTGAEPRPEVEHVWGAEKQKNYDRYWQLYENHLKYIKIYHLS